MTVTLRALQDLSEDLQGDGGAGFGIGEGVVVAVEVVAAGCSHYVELMVTQAAARRCEGAVEFIVRIVHLISLEDGFQATFVEGTVMGYERKTFKAVGHLSPYVGKDRS